MHRITDTCNVAQYRSTTAVRRYIELSSHHNSVHSLRSRIAIVAMIGRVAHRRKITHRSSHSATTIHNIAVVKLWAGRVSESSLIG